MRSGSVSLDEASMVNFTSFGSPYSKCSKSERKTSAGFDLSAFSMLEEKKIVKNRDRSSSIHTRASSESSVASMKSETKNKGCFMDEAVSVDLGNFGSTFSKSRSPKLLPSEAVKQPSSCSTSCLSMSTEDSSCESLVSRSDPIYGYISSKLGKFSTVSEKYNSNSRK